MKTVGIIGASGFLGSHITKVFLNQGKKVRASVTSLPKEEKYAHLNDLTGSEHLEIVELDVRRPEGFAPFLEGLDTVIHSGTPFKIAIEDPNEELFKPTIEGTKAFLEAVKDVESIKRIIFIASISSYNTNFPMPPGDYTPGKVINEHGTPFFSEESHPYAQSKFLANQAVNEFVEEHADFIDKIITVSPVSIMGPALSDRKDAESYLLQNVLKAKATPDPFFEMLYNTNPPLAMVDVRDVADIVRRLDSNTIDHSTRNYIISSGSYGILDVVEMLNGRKPVGENTEVYSSELVKKDLGIKFRSIDQALADFN